MSVKYLICLKCNRYAYTVMEEKFLDTLKILLNPNDCLVYICRIFVCMRFKGFNCI